MPAVELGEAERLEQHVLCARRLGLVDAFLVEMAGHRHTTRRVLGSAGAGRAQKVQTAAAGQAHVGQQQIEPVGAILQLLERLVEVRRGAYFVATTAQEGRDLRQQLDLVFDQQHQAAQGRVGHDRIRWGWHRAPR